MDNWILLIYGEVMAVVKEEGIEEFFDEVEKLYGDEIEYAAFVNPKSAFLADNVYS